MGSDKSKIKKYKIITWILSTTLVIAIIGIIIISVSSSENELTGIYLPIDPSDAMVIIFDDNDNLLFWEFDRNWVRYKGMWEIDGEELCIELFDDPRQCMEYQLSGDLLKTYTPMRGGGVDEDIFEKIY
mgnify:CR=1 FL=1